MMKGAPDILFPRCGFVQRPDATRTPLSDDRRARLQKLQVDWAKDGKRVLILCERTLDINATTADPGSLKYDEEILAAAKGLTIVGMIAIVDPPVRSFPRAITKKKTY